MSRSVPVAGLQLLVLLGLVGGGYVRCERTARRTDTGSTIDRGLLDVVGTLLFAAAGLVVLAPLSFGIIALPATYDHGTVDLLSWEESVAFLWVLVAVAVPVALFELRLASACWRRRSWAPWGAGIQLGLLATGLLWGSLPSS